MLKAYSYIQSEQMDTSIVDKFILAEEKHLISKFVAKNPTPKCLHPCVFCDGTTNEFAVIDEVLYQRCSACYSIFAKVEAGLIERYKAYKPLIDFRNSDEYQNSAEIRRDGLWNDLIFWINYRIARYLRQTKALDVIDLGNRYRKLSQMIRNTAFCGSYNSAEAADVALFFDQFRCLSDPLETILSHRKKIKDNGLLIMNTRVGSGFDVLTLRGASNIFPYESILLPSIEGLEIVLDNAGFDILEISTPGTLDVENVLQSKDCLGKDDLFVQYLLEKSNTTILAEFQRFLQKSGMSSHARVIARKRSK